MIACVKPKRYKTCQINERRQTKQVAFCLANNRFGKPGRDILCATMYLKSTRYLKWYWQLNSDVHKNKSSEKKKKRDKEEVL